MRNLVLNLIFIYTLKYLYDSSEDEVYSSLIDSLVRRCMDLVWYDGPYMPQKGHIKHKKE